MSVSAVRNVSPEELFEEAALAVQANPNDPLNWLLGERHLEAAKRREAEIAGNSIVFNHHDDRVGKIASIISEVSRVREINAHMQKALVNRVIVALTAAEKPAWEPTHKHYKGTLYRVTGTRQDANGDELVEGVEYDDAAGNRFYLHRSRFEDKLESGRLRFQPLLEGDV